MREALFYILSSFWAGAVHAATPGHGKTIAAAYIVGARGKPIDAVILGIFVTLSHTSGIVLVGVLASLGSGFLRPQRIEAWLTEVIIELGADRAIRLADLPLKSHERLFFERVPLAEEQRAEIKLSDEWRYAALAEAVEAWGFRVMQGRGELLSLHEVAEAWFHEEYKPVVEMLREAELIRRGTETESYMRVSHLRYLILRTHEWTDDVIERLREELAHPTWEEDTMVRRMRKELT